MELSIGDIGELVEMKEFAPGRAKKLAGRILDINRRLGILSNRRARDYIKIKTISESEQILTLIFSDFLALFNSVSDLLKKGGDIDNQKKLLNDLTNLRKEINQKTNELVARPPEIIYLKYWHDVDALISQPINSLILPSLIVSWQESKEQIDSNHFMCKKDLFYETFYKEVLSLIGQFPMVQVFKAPIKTVGVSPTSSAELRSQMLGMFEELKASEKNKEEFRKNIPPELVKDSDNENEEIIEEDIEEIKGDEG